MRSHPAVAGAAVTRALSVALAVGLLVGGCGFRLARGPQASDLDALWVTPSSRENPVAAALLERVRRSGAIPAERQAEAALVVTLKDTELRRRTLTVTDEARTAEYALIGVVTYSVARDGETLIAARRIEADAVLLRDRDDLLGSSEEQALLTEEIHARLAERILRAIGHALAGERPAAGPGAAERGEEDAAASASRPGV